MDVKNNILSLLIFLLLSAGASVSAHQPQIIYSTEGDIQIQNPEISQAFYDELKGTPRNYFINSDKDFNLYINLLVPESTNRNGRYSANIVLLKDDGTEEQITAIDGKAFEWQEYYESFGRDYYFKGPEFEKQVLAGKYKIEVFSADNLGKYVLAVGKTESLDVQSLLNIYWQLPMLKIQFFQTSVLEFFLTPFGIGLVALLGGLLIIWSILNFIVGAIKDAIKHRMAKTILLTSAGMQMKEEIVKLLQKPAYDVNVAFITTASKGEEDISYMENERRIMQELGFNVQEIDIEGKNEAQVMELLHTKDFIYVAGGNAFYLMRAMRQCNFEKVMRKLLKLGKVYVGVSAGSIVAGPTIETAIWCGDKNNVGLKNFKGLNFVPFNLVVHYKTENALQIQERINKSKHKVRVLADNQAFLIQGKNIALLGGEGEYYFRKKLTVILAVKILFKIAVVLAVIWLIVKLFLNQ